MKDEQAARGADWTADIPRLPVPVTAIHLIESRLTSAGPIYTGRFSSELAE